MVANLQVLPLIGPSHQDQIHLLSLHTLLVSNACNSQEEADFLARTKVYLEHPYRSSFSSRVLVGPREGRQREGKLTSFIADHSRPKGKRMLAY